MSYARQASTPREPVEIESVSQLTIRLKRLVEGGLGRVAVEGEISGCRPHRNGHLYTKIKDEDCTLSLTVWKSTLSRIRFRLEDGLQIVAHGKIEVYPPYGTYSLIADRIEPVGQGSLDLAFRQICERLRGEGLFDEARKRELPQFPRRVVVVSSQTSAALRDFWRVARERWPLADILVLDTPVQGESAGENLTRAMQAARRIGNVDVIVITRGGGSREDLWCFNDENLARAIAASPVPVVSAVGHEIDTTVSDLVADVRAATPTHAATMIFPDAKEILRDLGNVRTRLIAGMAQKLYRTERALEQSDRRMISAGSKIAERAGNEVGRAEMRLRNSIRQKIARCSSDFERQMAVLESLSPLKVLTRGYSVTVRAGDGKVVRSIQDVAPGTPILTELGDGRIRSVSESVESRANGS